MSELVSIIIPVRNAAATIGQCLHAAFASDYDSYEVIVVDDASIDQSVDIIKQFPCKLIQLKSHCGTSTARNTGAENSSGTILFFTDADCLLLEDTLSMVSKSLNGTDKNTVLGGSYTLKPVDDNFFARFQSAFIHYFETKNAGEADYIAAHAMAIYTSTFEKNQGFTEAYLPIIEDVEFSHRLRRSGCKLVINSKLQVRHVFNYSLWTSLYNGFRKAMYWTVYSLHNKDLLADSGTASIALKFNVVSWFLTSFIVAILLMVGGASLLILILLLTVSNLLLNVGVLRKFNAAGETRFFLAAILYYFLIYPLAVGVGGITGLIRYKRYAKLLQVC